MPRNTSKIKDCHRTPRNGITAGTFLKGQLTLNKRRVHRIAFTQLKFFENHLKLIKIIDAR